MKKRRQGAWVMLLTLLAWWHSSPAGAIESFANVGLSETSPPAIISQLNQIVAPAPQVYIISPRSEEIVADTEVVVQLQVVGTPIFKNTALGLGPHLHLLLDRVPTQSIYDLNAPIVLSNLTPGTHTLQVLANKPWHESWKNREAFTQVTFHVLAKSSASPDPRATQLISVQPTVVGAQPWLLDFYLANAPSHADPQHPLRQINDWRVRTTINEQSFEMNQGQPIYLRGLRPGANVLKLEYLDTQGQVADQVIRVIKYQPNGTDGLSRLLRNELSIEQALALFDPQSRVVAAVPKLEIAPAIPLTVPSPIASPVVPLPIYPTIPINPVTVPVPVLPEQSWSKQPEIVATIAIPIPIPKPVATPTMGIEIAPSPNIPALPSQSPIVVVPISPIFSLPTAQILPKSELPLPTVIDLITPSVVPEVASPLIAKPLTPAAEEEVVAFRVIWQEFLHTTSVEIKRFTNQIPPLVSAWREKFSRWVSDRMTAMRPQPDPTKSATSVR